MKKIIKSLAIPAALLSSSAFSACPDISGTWVGSCDNAPAEFFQIRTVISQQGCDNVQVLMDWIALPGNPFGLPEAFKFTLRTMDINPGTFEEFKRVNVNANEIVTTEREAMWVDGDTRLEVMEETKYTDLNKEDIPGKPEAGYAGEFYLDDNGETLKLEMTKGEDGTGNCVTYRFP